MPLFSGRRLFSPNDCIKRLGICRSSSARERQPPVHSCRRQETRGCLSYPCFPPFSDLLYWPALSASLRDTALRSPIDQVPSGQDTGDSTASAISQIMGTSRWVVDHARRHSRGARVPTSAPEWSALRRSRHTYDTPPLFRMRHLRCSFPWK